MIYLLIYSWQFMLHGHVIYSYLLIYSLKYPMKSPIVHRMFGGKTRWLKLGFHDLFKSFRIGCLSEFPELNCHECIWMRHRSLMSSRNCHTNDDKSRSFSAKSQQQWYELRSIQTIINHLECGLVHLTLSKRVPAAHPVRCFTTHEEIKQFDPIFFDRIPEIESQLPKFGLFLMNFQNKPNVSMHHRPCTEHNTRHVKRPGQAGCQRSPSRTSAEELETEIGYSKTSGISNIFVNDIYIYNIDVFNSKYGL